MKSMLLSLLALLISTNAWAQPPLDIFIASYAKEHNFNGTILVQKNHKVIYLSSFGLANFRFDVANTVQTKYHIASITKVFTSVLVLQLQEQGLLDLNKTIKTYLPNYTGPAADKVTLHQLLNHTSGIENMDKVKSVDEAIKIGVPVYQTPHTADQLLTQFASGPLVHTPGSVFDYNNADYIILGKIIERVSGKTYDQILKARILQPLEMMNTGMSYQHNIIHGLADTYFFREDLGTLVPDLPIYPENSYAAGGMYSTVNDLLKFSNALFGEKLLKRDSLARMIKPGLDDYGYGLWSYETNIGGKKYRVVKRPGQIMGAQSQLYHFMDAGVTVIMLSNTGTTDLDQFVAEIGKRVVGNP